MKTIKLRVQETHKRIAQVLQIIAQVGSQCGTCLGKGSHTSSDIGVKAKPGTSASGSLICKGCKKMGIWVYGSGIVYCNQCDQTITTSSNKCAGCSIPSWAKTRSHTCGRCSGTGGTACSQHKIKDKHYYCIHNSKGTYHI